jgi:predicted ATP-grasp superfamily ATP-dependent carboligase
MTAESAIGVVGASVRAAMQSLLRAGFQGWGIDLFADRDLKRLAPCSTCPSDSFPKSLPSLITNFPPGPIIYTGGLENHPEVVSELAVNRMLWGNPPEVLNRVRDPHVVNRILKTTGRCPGLVPPGDPCPGTGRWLRKPLRSSSGFGIRFAAPHESASSGHYFQEFIEGSSLSALFISTGMDIDGNNQTHLLGITEQLIGQPWLHARPFAYCGNIGPIPLQHEAMMSLLLSASRLSSDTGLRGLWGIDFILSDGIPFPVEVNPRYTAAIEILELGLGLSCMSLHRDCFEKTSSSLQVYASRKVSTVICKAIYYAPHRIIYPHSGPWDEDLATAFDPWRVPSFADIPEAQSVIEAGFPVLTLFAKGSTAMDCIRGLQSRAGEMDRIFAGNTP